MATSSHSYLDCWPHPLTETFGDNIGRISAAYFTGLSMFLDTDFLPKYPLTEGALRIFGGLAPRLFNVRRWKDYKVDEMGDMNVASHSLRQAGITAQALYFDCKSQGIEIPERDYMISAAVLHDLGELGTGDLTYDIKQRSRTEAELEEAKEVFKLVDSFSAVVPRRREELKEVYAQVTTSEEAARMLVKETCLPQTDWSKLRRMFQLYERYGYLITAIEQYPYKLGGMDLPEDDLRPFAWNRAELEAALKGGEEVPDKVRAYILFKNVLLNQWPHIARAAQEGVRSASLFFNNDLTKPIVTQSNRFLVLDLDLSLFYANGNGLPQPRRASSPSSPSNLEARGPLQ